MPGHATGSTLFGINLPFKPGVEIPESIVFTDNRPPTTHPVFHIISGLALLGHFLPGANGQSLLGLIPYSQLGEQVTAEKQGHGLGTLLRCQSVSGSRQLSSTDHEYDLIRT